MRSLFCINVTLAPGWCWQTQSHLRSLEVQKHPLLGYTNLHQHQSFLDILNINIKHLSYWTMGGARWFTLTLVMSFTYPQNNMTDVPLVVGIRPDVLPDERFVPGPLPLLSEGLLVVVQCSWWMYMYIFARNSPQNSYESSLGPFRKNIKYTSIVMLELASLFKHFYRRHVFLHFDLCRTYSGAYILSFFLENSHREVSLCSTATTRKWKLSNSAQHGCLV